jgi:hypothetical protein
MFIIMAVTNYFIIILYYLFSFPLCAPRTVSNYESLRFVLPLKAKNDASPRKPSTSMRCSSFHLGTLTIKGCADLLLDYERSKMEYKSTQR